MDIAALKEAIDLHDLFEKLGLKKGRSGNYHAPLRKDEKPSISIYDRGKKWKDHGDSEKGGSAVDIVMLVKDCDVPTAMRFLHDLYGFTTSATHPPEQPIQSLPKVPYLWQVTSHHKDRQKAVDYLIEDRKLPRDFVEKLAGKAFGFSDYRPANNPTDPGHGPAVVFPCGLPGQPPAVLNLRYIEPDHDPKTRFIGDPTGALFVAPDWASIKKAKIVWWVEAPIDALTLAAAGCPAISFLSVSLADTAPLHCMKVEQIIRLWADNDEPGKLAARKLYHRAIDAGLTPQCVDIAGFAWKDPNDGLQKGLTLDDIKNTALSLSTALFPVGHAYLPNSEFHTQLAIHAYLDHMEISSTTKDKEGNEKINVSQISGFRIYRLDSLRLHDPSSIFGGREVEPEIRTLIHYRRVDSATMRTAVVPGADLGKLTTWQNLGWIHSSNHFMRISQIIARDTWSTRWIGNSTASNQVWPARYHPYVDYSTG